MTVTLQRFLFFTSCGRELVVRAVNRISYTRNAIMDLSTVNLKEASISIKSEYAIAQKEIELMKVLLRERGNDFGDSE